MAARSCRICLESAEEVLISPCAGCRGSSALVHLSCVTSFYRSRACWWDLSCPTCKHLYEGKVAVELGEIGLVELERDTAQSMGALSTMLTNLGNAYGRSGDAARQRDLLLKALAMNERMHGPEHEKVAVTLTNLANVFGEFGDHTLKQRLLEKALGIFERQLGADHSKVAITLANLANVNGDLGNVVRMRDLLTRALAIQEREHGPDDSVVAMMLTNLGNAHGQLGDLQRQRELLTRALPMLERKFGREHEISALALVNVAASHAALGDGELVEQACVEAMRRSRAALPWPSSTAARISLSTAAARFAATRPQVSTTAARLAWDEAAAELRAAVGEHAARTQLQEFRRKASNFWRAAGRSDVVAWFGIDSGTAAERGGETDMSPVTAELAVASPQPLQGCKRKISEDASLRCEVPPAQRHRPVNIRPCK